jgi:PIN domain nuclease of toxin-antitoxin system
MVDNRLSSRPPAPSLPLAALAEIENPENELLFSPVSLWEVAIKRSLRRADFDVDPRLLRRGLLGNGYRELSVTGENAVNVDALPAIRKDPFDRFLLAQAIVEGILLLTVDEVLVRYPGPVRQF